VRGKKIRLELGRPRSLLNTESTETQRTQRRKIAMPNQERTGILVVGHGSRRQEANDDVRDVAQKIAEIGGF